MLDDHISLNARCEEDNVFERFIKDARHLERYNAEPFADERKQFLVHLQESGYSHGRLTVINRLLLAVAKSIRLDRDAQYSPLDLAVLAKTWIRKRSNHGASEKFLHVMEMDFLFVAKRWMEFLGRLIVLVPPQPYSSELDRFLRHLRTERGFADATIKNHQRNLKPFLSWLNEQSLSLSQVHIDNITAYQTRCSQRGWKRTTISLHVQALRGFLRYAGSQGWCSDISSAIAAPRLYTNEGIPLGPSWNEVRKLISNELGDSAVQIRNRAMLLLFAVYGFRLSEVRGLRLEDVDWENERISIRRTKLRKTHQYPLTREVGDAILRYLTDVRPKSSHRVMFLSLRQPYRPLSAGGLSTMVQKRMQGLNAGLARLGPHSLRHACATHLLAEGFSLKQISDHLGHVSAAATRMYAKVDIPDLREVAALNLSELVRYVAGAEQAQTPVIPRGDLAGLREVATLNLGSLGDIT
jgi:site-specific recombinase XerD